MVFKILPESAEFIIFWRIFHDLMGRKNFSQLCEVAKYTGACLWVVQRKRVVVAGATEEVAGARAMLEELLGRDT